MYILFNDIYGNIGFGLKKKIILIVLEFFFILDL